MLSAVLFCLVPDVNSIANANIEIEKSRRNSAERSKPVFAIAFEKKIAARIEITAKAQTERHDHSCAPFRPQQVDSPFQHPRVEVRATSRLIIFDRVFAADFGNIHVGRIAYDHIESAVADNLAKLDKPVKRFMRAGPFFA